MYLRKLFSKAIIIFLLIGANTKPNQMHAHNHFDRLQCYLDGYLIDKNGNWIEEIPPEKYQVSYGAEYIIEKLNQSKYLVRKTLILSDEDSKKFGNNIELNHDQIISNYKRNFNSNFEDTKFKNGKIFYLDDSDNSNVILDLTNKEISRINRLEDYGHKGSCRKLSTKYPPQQGVNLKKLGFEYSLSLNDLSLSEKEKGQKSLLMYEESLNSFLSWSDFIYPEEIQNYKELSELYLLMGAQYDNYIKNFTLAAQEYSKAIDIDPSNIRAYLFTAEAYFNSGQDSKSMKLLNAYLKQWEEGNKNEISSFSAAKAYFLRGIIKNIYSEKKEACDNFSKAKLTHKDYIDRLDEFLNDAKNPFNKGLKACGFL